jgi:ribosomal protein S18 acetylase RimI-like enzyme
MDTRCDEDTEKRLPVGTPARNAAFAWIAAQKNSGKVRLPGQQPRLALGDGVYHAGCRVNPSLNIRRGKPGDETLLSLVGQASFLEAFAGVINGPDIVQHCLRQHSVAKYEHYLHDAQTCIWIAEAAPGGAPVGYLVLTTPDLPVADLDPRELEVKRVYLLHRFQGSGLGARLMQAATEHAAALGAPRLLLGVYAKNDAAIGFYERLGYAKIGTRAFEVGGSTYHDFVMALPLAREAGVGRG